MERDTLRRITLPPACQQVPMAGSLCRNQVDVGSIPSAGSMHVVAAGAAVGLSHRLSGFDSRHVLHAQLAVMVKAFG